MIQSAETPSAGGETPRESRHVPVEPDEVYEFLADESHLLRWWSPPDDLEGEPHFDAEPSAHRIHLRWGSPGMWRHMIARIEREREGARVWIEFVPVPGCGGVCLEREILRAAGWLARLQKTLEVRSHLLDSDHLWT